jgi:hypothetical protein
LPSCTNQFWTGNANVNKYISPPCTIQLKVCPSLNKELRGEWVCTVHLLLQAKCRFGQGILKGDESLYSWPPVWLVWNQLWDNGTIFVFICKTGYSKQIKQEVNSTVILPPLVFPGLVKENWREGSGVFTFLFYSTVGFVTEYWCEKVMYDSPPLTKVWPEKTY